MSINAPDCYACTFRRALPGDAHSSCVNLTAHVTGNITGHIKGWFTWPTKFDPVWLLACNGFEPNRQIAEKEK